MLRSTPTCDEVGLAAAAALCVVSIVIGAGLEVEIGFPRQLRHLSDNGYAVGLADVPRRTAMRVRTMTLAALR